MEFRIRALPLSCVAVGIGLAGSYLLSSSSPKISDGAVESQPIETIERPTGNASHDSSQSATYEQLNTGKQEIVTSAHEGTASIALTAVRSTRPLDEAWQQRAAALRKDATRSLYDKLVKELKLNEREAKELIDLLAELQAATTHALESSPIAQPNIQARIMGEVRKNGDDRVLSLLGADKFAKYEEFQRTLSQHLQVRQLSDALLASGQLALSEKQEEELYKVLVEEKEIGLVPLRYDALSKAAVNERIKLAEDYNRRVLERAGNILTSEQLAQFRAGQQRLLQSTQSPKQPNPIKGS